ELRFECALHPHRSSFVKQVLSFVTRISSCVSCVVASIATDSACDDAARVAKDASRFFQRDWVPLPHHPFGQHPCIEPTPAWVSLLGDTLVVSVQKPSGIVLARGGIAHDLQLYRLPNAQAVARLERSPVHPAQGQVLSAGPRSDRVPFSLQLLDHLERKEADRT